MNIHEYQAKQLLRDYGVAVPNGGVAFTVDEAAAQAEELGGPVYVVKSQIHAGGRGAGKFQDNPDGKGGVRVVKSLEEVRESAGEMLGHVLITKQTGPAGKEVKRIYVEDGSDIARELYLGMLLDRETSRLTMMASTEGGMEIEEVAAETPEKILKISIDPATGMTEDDAKGLAEGLGLEGRQVDSGVQFMLAVYKAFTELDASIVEINPLVVTGAGDIMALDAKINFDDNALFRQQCYINGHWCDADDGATFTVTNPATDESLGTSPRMGEAETRQAIDAALFGNAAGDPVNVIIGRQSMGHGLGIGRLAVVDVEHARTLTDALHAVRQAGEGAQALANLLAR